MAGAVLFIHDAAAVADCVAAGVGRTLELEVGGKLDVTAGDPIAIPAKIELLWGGPDEVDIVLRDAVGVAVVRVGSNHVVLTRNAVYQTSPAQFRRFGIDPARKRIVVVQSAHASDTSSSQSKGLRDGSSRSTLLASRVRTPLISRIGISSARCSRSTIDRRWPTMGGRSCGRSSRSKVPPLGPPSRLWDRDDDNAEVKRGRPDQETARTSRLAKRRFRLRLVAAGVSLWVPLAPRRYRSSAVSGCRGSRGPARRPSMGGRP